MILQRRKKILEEVNGKMKEKKFLKIAIWY